MWSLPWMWSNTFYEGQLHPEDREPLGPKRWYQREFRKAKIEQAMLRMDELVREYRLEQRAKKEYTWFERQVSELVGDQLAQQFLRKRTFPKL